MRRSRSLELWGLGGEKAMKSRAQWQLTDAKARGMQHKTDNVQQTTGTMVAESQRRAACDRPTSSDGSARGTVSTFGVLRVLTQVPKLGSLQRWVRDCDAAGDDPRALEVSEC